MSNALLQLLVLAAIAVFLIVRLRNVLGTRDGYEPPPKADNASLRSSAEIIDLQADAFDNDIHDHVEPGNPAAEALTEMKQVEPSFLVGPFLSGAKAAYEMILMAFERGDLSDVRDFLAPEVAEAFDAVIEDRKNRNLITDANYLGTRETMLAAAQFDSSSGHAEISVRFVSEMMLTVRNAAGEIVEGDNKSARKQRDTWTFARQMGQNDPNWRLVATA